MKQIHIDRLLKLADHLEHGQLGHTVFDFDNYNVDKVGAINKAHQEPSCGYAGCAIGECPIVFPDDWCFNQQGWPVTLKHTTRYAIQIFFDISECESGHLFMPKSQYPMNYGGQRLTEKATKEEVAANIRAFVALKLPTLEK